MDVASQGHVQLRKCDADLIALDAELVVGGRLAQAGQEAVYHAAKVALLWRKHRQEGTRQLIRACEEIGKIAHIMGLRIEEYKNHS